MKITKQEDLPYESELMKSEYQEVKMRAMMDLHLDITAIKSGKNRDQLLQAELEKNQKAKTGGFGKYVSWACLVLLIGRYIFTKYKN